MNGSAHQRLHPARKRASPAVFHSPDVEDLIEFKPVDTVDFGFLLQVFVGPSDSDGEESFEVLVCTPERLLKGGQAAATGAHSVLIAAYDWSEIERCIRGVVSEVVGETWREIALQLHDRLGRWEFADYRSR